MGEERPPTAQIRRTRRKGTSVTGLVVPAILRDGPGRTPEGRAWIDRLPVAGRACGPAVGAHAGRAVHQRGGVVVRTRHAARRTARGAQALLPARRGAARGRGAARLARPRGPGAARVRRGRLGPAARHASSPGTPLAVAPGTPEDAADRGRRRGAGAVVGRRRSWSSRPCATSAPAGPTCSRTAGRGTASTSGSRPTCCATCPVRPASSCTATSTRATSWPRAAGGWLAIDPKPMRGDPAYDLWPLLEQVDDPFAHARSRAASLRERIGSRWPGSSTSTRTAWRRGGSRGAPSRRCGSGTSSATSRARDAILGQAAVWARLARLIRSTPSRGRARARTPGSSACGRPRGGCSGARATNARSSGESRTATCTSTSSTPAEQVDVAHLGPLRPAGARPRSSRARAAACSRTAIIACSPRPTASGSTCGVEAAQHPGLAQRPHPGVAGRRGDAGERRPAPCWRSARRARAR